MAGAPGKDPLAAGVRLMEAGDYFAAIDTLRRGLREGDDPEDPLILLNLAIAYSRLNLHDICLEICDELLRQPGGLTDRVHLHQLRLFSLLRLKKYQRFEQAARQALQVYPENIPILALFGYFLEQSGKEEAALEVFKKILDLEPENINAMNSWAYLSARQGRDLDACLRYSARTLRSRPVNPAYLDTFGVILAKMGNREAARKAFQKALENTFDREVLFEHVRQYFPEIAGGGESTGDSPPEKGSAEGKG